jgi:regulatory protein
VPKPRKKLPARELFEYAVRSLARRGQSSAELRAKLRERAEDPLDIDPAIARLREYGYLDDKRFAEQFATARLENQRFGRARTLNDLRGRRVVAPIVEAAVENAYKDTNEVALVEDYIRRKFRNAPREHLFESDKDLAAAYRRLLRAGFRSGVVIPVLKRFAKNPDLLDGIEEPVE